MNISSLTYPTNGVTTPSAIGPNGQSGQLSSTPNGTPNASPSVVADGSLPQDKRQAALQIVDRTLTLAYEKISSRGLDASAKYSAFEPLTAEKVSSNILGFIERRLQLDVAEGASQEALQARLEAGLAGFKKGFAEASEKLEALSLLSPEIKSDIGKTYDLVLEGIDALRAKFIQSAGAIVSQSSDSQSPPVLKTPGPKSKATTLDVPAFLPAKASQPGYGAYEYGRARQFNFELTTKEGDKVSIKAASSEGMAFEYGRAARGDNSTSRMNASYSGSQSFSLVVDGDLNEDELAAINELLGRVSDLAGQFFDGNLDEAFNQAMSLGYDPEQIGSFALNLAQAEIRQVTQAYQTFEPDRDANKGDRSTLLVDQLLPLSNFIKELLASLDQASLFAEPRLLLTNVAEKITGEGELDLQQGKRFSDFVAQIAALDLK